MVIRHDPKIQLIHQIESFYYGEVSDEDRKNIELAYPVVLEKLENCFLHVNNKYYRNNGEAQFDPLHVAQWTMFLYEMASCLKKKFSGNVDMCDKIYGISKCFSSADLYYEIGMPDIYFFDHPQGSVMGRAQYADFFTFSQGCTVGNNKGIYPKFGEHVSMMSGSKILGKCCIGDHVIMSANSYIIDQDVPSYSIVFGSSPNPVIHSITPKIFNELTCSMFDGNDSAMRN